MLRKKFPRLNQCGFFFWGTIGCTDSEKLKTNSPLLSPHKCSYKSYTPRLCVLLPATWWGRYAVCYCQLHGEEDMLCYCQLNGEEDMLCVTASFMVRKICCVLLPASWWGRYAVCYCQLRGEEDMLCVTDSLMKKICCLTASLIAEKI